MPKTVQLIILLSLLPATLSAEIVNETGSLQGFLQGEAPGCDYDNYVSHIVEGIADDGYNHYNPLDPQSNGFGSYLGLDADDAGLLDTFKQFFSYCVSGQFQVAESYRETELAGYPYRLVHLAEPVGGGEFYLFRELLDSSFVDENTLPEPDDDEVGSFTHGWGLYVFAVNPSTPQVVVEMPHPCDDFISPAVGYDIFNTLGAGALFITGAGREVVWTEQGGYDNSKSLCDPTRNGFHLFQMAHEAFVDHYLDELQEQPLTIQVHSYDSRGRNHPSVIVAPGRHDTRYNLPLFDWSGVIGGFIDRTTTPVHPVGFIGNPEAVPIEQYYGSNSTPRLVVVDSSDVGHELPDPNELLGYSGNLQFIYREDEFNSCSDLEWLCHLELDELPDCISDTTEAEFYGGAGFPITRENFSAAIDYYHPVAANLAATLDSIATFPDSLSPAAPEYLTLLDYGLDWAELGWDPAPEPFLESYRLYYADYPPVDTTCSFFDAADYSSLCHQYTNSLHLENLTPGEPLFFRLATINLEGEISAFSNLLSLTPEDNEPPLILIDGPADDFRLWWTSDSGSVQATIADNAAGVDGSALQYRRDWNQDDDYEDPGEEWATLPAVPDFLWIDAEYHFGFAEHPAGARFELRARDIQQGEWSYSGSDGAAGIDDDWQIFYDVTPPDTPLQLTATGITWNYCFDLTWTASADDPSFESYLLFYQFEQQPDSSSNSLDQLTLPQLAEIGCDSVRIDFLHRNGVYWIALAARDLAGNVSELSEAVPVELSGGPAPFTLHSLQVVADDNGNGIPEAGEIVEFEITLTNSSSGSFEQLTGTLTSDVAYLQLQQDSVYFPSLGPTEQGTSQTPFSLLVNEWAPDFFSDTLQLSLLAAEYDGCELELPLSGGARELYYLYDVENDTAGWHHYAAAGWEDDWHRSLEKYQSPVRSWKCGSNWFGDYENHMDARLESPPITLLPHSHLRFRHWMEAEVSGSHPDSAYDGGIIEISTDGGSRWEQLIPSSGGYNAWFRHQNGGGDPTTHPFTPGIPCYSGSFDWTDVGVDLEAYADSSVVFRFRFGSDDGTNEEGWYIDDIALYGFTPPLPQLEIDLQFELPDQITISWEPHPEAVGYRIYRSDEPFGSYQLLDETSVTSYQLSSAGAVSWFYRVTWLDD